MAAQAKAPTPRRGTKLTIGFGLVNVDVKYAPLVESGTGRTSAKTCCRTHMAPVSSEYRCTEGGESVDPADKVMAYEVDGNYVEVDTKSLGLESDKRLELTAAVEPQAVDQLYVEKAHMLWPQDGHEGGYDLLTAILRESGKVLVGTTAIGKATRAVLVRWSERTQTLLAHVCTYDERIAWTDLELVREGAKRRDAPAPEMIAIGEQLLDSLSGEFDFAEVSDEYASELDEAIALAASGKPAKAKPKEKAAAPAGDLMAALQASVKAAPAKKAGKKVAA